MPQYLGGKKTGLGGTALGDNCWNLGLGGVAFPEVTEPRVTVEKAVN